MAAPALGTANDHGHDFASSHDHSLAQSSLDTTSIDGEIASAPFLDLALRLGRMLFCE